MKPEIADLRMNMAHLLGRCESAKALVEYDVPKAWIKGLIDECVSLHHKLEKFFPYEYSEVKK